MQLGSSQLMILLCQSVMDTVIRVGSFWYLRPLTFQSFYCINLNMSAIDSTFMYSQLVVIFIIMPGRLTVSNICLKELSGSFI